MTTKQLSFKSTPQLAIAEADTTPNPGIPGVSVWSTTLSKLVYWTGSIWTAGVGVTLTGTETLTNKTLTNPVISGTPATTAGMKGYDTIWNVPTFYNGTTVRKTGYLNVPLVSANVNTTLTKVHAGGGLKHPTSDITARTFTIDSNANQSWEDGTVLTIWNQNAAGVVTIVITTDTMRLAGAGTTGSRTLAANGICTAIWDTATTTWIISGTGLT